jgi:hypothetical protein
MKRQATNAEMIINLARSMTVGDSAFLEAAGSLGGCWAEEGG